MPDIELSFRRQKALLWAASGFDDFGQHKRAAFSIELKVRWVEQQREALDSQGNTIALDAQVVVDREIAIGSVMWKGSLNDLADSVPGTGTGTGLLPTSDLWEVVTYEETPDLKGRVNRRTVGLKRFRDTMPASV